MSIATSICNQEVLDEPGMNSSGKPDSSMNLRKAVYDSFIVRTLWQQIRLFTTIAGLGMSIGMLLVANPEKH